MLGIEAGGTRTTTWWDDPGPGPNPVAAAARKPREFPGANLHLVADTALFRLLRTIAQAHPTPAAVAIGMAGHRTAADATRLRSVARRVWPTAVIHTSHDLDTALAADAVEFPEPAGNANANANASANASANAVAARVLVLSGTGSCCYGRTPDDRTARVGGWGHILGDAGSAYAIALDTLRGLVHTWDTTGHWPPLGARLLSALHLNEPNDLVPWAQQASKADLAALAPHVLSRGAADPHARAALRQALHALTESAVACARKLVRPGKRVRFVLAGGVLQRPSAWQRQLVRRLRQLWPTSTVTTLRVPGARGAAHLARLALTQSRAPRAQSSSARAVRSPRPAANLARAIIPTATTLSPTEQRNPRSRELDRLPWSAAIRLFLTEDRRLPGALLAEAPHLERALRLIVRGLRRGGRLIYVGAGTSGRLGVLDASECPPTFRTPPELVEGILAGGRDAMFRSVEGAEDDFDGGGRAVAVRHLRAEDVVVGIAASGRTPFVWGALHEARRRGAPTILVCFHPHLRFARGHRPDVVIAPRIGPELLTGSTRLKSGTATKQILNLFTTLAMVRLGKVIGNLMVDVNPANAKLRERAIRICRELTGVDAAAAEKALVAAGWVVKSALRKLGRKGV